MANFALKFQVVAQKMAKKFGGYFLHRTLKIVKKIVVFSIVYMLQIPSALTTNPLSHSVIR